MKTATLTETKNSPSALIDQVRNGETVNGETVIVLDRGRPVARIESAIQDGVEVEGRLARLERSGVIRRATKPLPCDILSRGPVSPASGASALAALLDERESGR